MLSAGLPLLEMIDNFDDKLLHCTAAEAAMPLELETQPAWLIAVRVLNWSLW